MKFELEHAEMASAEKINDEMDAHVLNNVKDMVSNDLFQAVMQWVSDEDNGIFGGFEIVENILGDYQELSHEGGYWLVLDGIWVDQYQNMCDTFYGSQCVKLGDDKYLKGNFNL